MKRGVVGGEIDVVGGPDRRRIKVTRLNRI
jgi:hypothetical protein